MIEIEFWRKHGWFKSVFKESIADYDDISLVAWVNTFILKISMDDEMNSWESMGQIYLFKAAP